MGGDPESPVSPGPDCRSETGTSGVETVVDRTDDPCLQRARTGHRGRASTAAALVGAGAGALTVLLYPALALGLVKGRD